jgi:hypothetical protein
MGMRRRAWTRRGLSLGLMLILLLPSWGRVGNAGTGPDPLSALDVPAGMWRLPFVLVSHSAIYDAANQRVIVFGGWNGRQFSNSVWALDVTEGSEAWGQLLPEGPLPPSRGQHTAIYDAANQRMIVYGGHSVVARRVMPRFAH